MKRHVMLLVAVLSLLAVVAPAAVSAQGPGEDAPRDYPPIEGYTSPCRGGTHAEIFSWHGINQDGLPPVDLDRRSVDFLCEDKAVYAPYGGEIYGTTGRYGGLILIDDAEHDGCIVLLGLEAFNVSAGQAVQQGDRLGTYRWHVHIAVTDGDCEAANWYDWDARAIERPVLYTELGEVVPSDILERDAWPFISQNPSRDAE